MIKGDQAALTGVINSQVHYLLIGNVHLVSSKECKEEKFTFVNEEDLANNLVQYIAMFETYYQAAVNQNYNDMHDETYKALRRQNIDNLYCPITGTTRKNIDWNRLCAELNKYGSEYQA